MAARFHSGYDAYRIVEGKPILIDYPPYKTHEDFGVSKKQKDTIVVNGRKHYFNHIEQIIEEQEPERTLKKFLIVRQEGNRSVKRNMLHYNLDMIIAVGYRVKSQVATRFRQWDRRRAS